MAKLWGVPEGTSAVWGVLRPQGGACCGSRKQVWEAFPGHRQTIDLGAAGALGSQPLWLEIYTVPLLPVEVSEATTPQSPSVSETVPDLGIG